jgi:hypothetical protein
VIYTSICKESRPKGPGFDFAAVQGSLAYKWCAGVMENWSDGVMENQRLFSQEMKQKARRETKEGS